MKSDNTEHKLVTYDPSKSIKPQAALDDVLLTVVDEEAAVVDRLFNKAKGKIDTVLDTSNDRIMGQVFDRLKQEVRAKVSSQFRDIETQFDGLDFVGMLGKS